MLEFLEMTTPMAAAYNPKAVEEGWYSWWEEQGFFKPEVILAKNPNASTYTIPIPPPNITGSLHLGHAMGLSIQDSLIRWKRMKGHAALFLPGCDHAGISCQVVVEKSLWKNKKLTRHDIGRAEFIKHVWQWKELYGNRIYTQFRKIGASLDWSRATFTLDPIYDEAVKNSFIALFEDGVIYRDNRLVHWSAKLQTTVSDLEVDSMEINGKTLLKVHDHDDKKLYTFGQMYDVAYKILSPEGQPVLDADGSGLEIVISTTRPETIPGDVAVAVHPKDPRYAKYHGFSLSHPLTGAAIPLVCDEIADMDFGTGAVKITPAHDANDFQVGLRHNLPFISILDEHNRLNEHAGDLRGLMRFDAREKVVQLLEEKKLLRGVKDHVMTIPICNRSGDIIEPRIRPQWWMKCSDIAKKSADVVRNGSMRLLPKESEKIWFHWLDNCKDWCLSRQLWWGHQIPAYQVSVPQGGSFWQAALSEKDAFERLQAKGTISSDIKFEDCQVEQDPDVFDTWYSAALWPLVTLGWTGPSANAARFNKQAQDLERYFPTSLLETGRDIIFFWVARMVMMSLYFTNSVPFTTVFLHSIVRDAHGRKMSKSLGNVIDPLDVINGISLEALHEQLLGGNLDPREISAAKEGQKKDFPKGISECGTDALRFALCAYTSPGADINLDIARVEGYRKFGNKIWNAAKFVITKLKAKPLDYAAIVAETLAKSDDLFIRWIVKRLHMTAEDLNNHLSDFNFLRATSAIHSFFLYDFCDIYIEVSKKQEGKDAHLALFHVLLTSLKMLHPFMPYLTEELYHRLHIETDTRPSIASISLCDFPGALLDVSTDMRDLEDVERLMHWVKAIRIKAKETKGSFEATLKLSDEKAVECITANMTALKSLVKNLKDVNVLHETSSSFMEDAAAVELSTLTLNN